MIDLGIIHIIILQSIFRFEQLSTLSGYQLGVFALAFMDAQDAGQQLAAKLMGYKNKNPFVLGIPRGGVVVAAEVAPELGAPLDVINPRKIGAPFNKELAVGAVAPDGTTIFDERALFMLWH